MYVNNMYVNKVCACTKLHYGVPKGSVLGPKQFNPYTFPLGNYQQHSINFHYVRDIQLYLSLNLDKTSGLSNLEACLKDLKPDIKTLRHPLGRVGLKPSFSIRLIVRPGLGQPLVMLPQPQAAKGYPMMHFSPSSYSSHSSVCTYVPPSMHDNYLISSPKSLVTLISQMGHMDTHGMSLDLQHHSCQMSPSAIITINIKVIIVFVYVTVLATGSSSSNNSSSNQKSLFWKSVVVTIDA